MLTNVPLYVRAPMLGAPPAGDVGDLVQLFDATVATTLDLAGVPSRHVHFARSLRPYLSNATASSWEPRDAVFAEGGYATNEPRDFEKETGHASNYWYKSHVQQTYPLSVCRAVSIRTNSWKLVYRSDPTSLDHDSELYDLANDPLELTNVYDANPEVATELKLRILDWMVLTSDVTPYSTCDRGTGKCSGEPW